MCTNTEQAWTDDVANEDATEKDLIQALYRQHSEDIAVIAKLYNRNNADYVRGVVAAVQALKEGE